MSRRFNPLLLACGLLIGAGINACTTDDDSGEVVAGACQMVIDACHSKDDGSDEMINGCHSVAHDGDDATCSTDLQACLDACNAADPVGGHDDHGHETDHDDHGETGHDDHGDTDHGTGHDGTHGDHGDTDHGDTDHGDTDHDDHGTTGDHGSTGADDSSDASCSELGSVCHDVADELGNTCHDIGHDGDEAACAKVWVECIEHCTA